MTPQQFIAKWQGCQLAERAFYQQHFNDLCALVGHPTPAAQDTTGDTFCFEKGATKPVSNIHADLTAGGNGGSDLTSAQPLKENAGWSYFGLCLAGAFKVPSETAQAWLKLPNPHGKPNSDVLKPIYNGSDITRRWAGDWVIDFALLDEQQAALYEAPFAYVVEHVKPTRIGNNRKARAEKWWRHGEARPGLRAKLAGLQRYIATPETAKHRFFVSFPITVAPEHSLIVIPSDSDALAQRHVPSLGQKVLAHMRPPKSSLSLRLSMAHHHHRQHLCVQPFYLFDDA